MIPMGASTPNRPVLEARRILDALETEDAAKLQIELQRRFAAHEPRPECGSHEEEKLELLNAIGNRLRLACLAPGQQCARIPDDAEVEISLLKHLAGAPAATTAWLI